VIVGVRLLRDRRRSSLGWAAGFLTLVVFTVGLYPSVRDQAAFDSVVRDLPESVKLLVGYDAAVPLTSPPGYLHGRLFALLAPLLALVFAIGAGADAIGGSEEAGTLEPLLANPVTRTRVFVERYAVLAGLLAGLIAVFALGLVAVGTPLGAMEGIALARVASACTAMLVLALLHGSLALAVGAATGRRGTAIAVSTVVAVAGYLAQSLVSLSPALRWLRYLTPWHSYLDRNLLAYGVTASAFVVPLVLSAALLAAGHAAFVRRDLR
jgi:ABC-2 type transport system permease protein